jgi:hypothetical protein
MSGDTRSAVVLTVVVLALWLTVFGFLVAVTS